MLAELFVDALHRRREGVGVLRKPAEVAAESNVIITMLPGSTEVEEVYLGEHGILQAVREGSVCIDTSSIDPVTAVRIASELRKKGASMLDAPVSGGQEKAESGTLSIMGGGDKTVLERCLGILKSMGRDVVLVGDSGAGQIAKLANLCIVAVNMAIVGEAMCLGKKGGGGPAKNLPGHTVRPCGKPVHDGQSAAHVQRGLHPRRKNVAPRQGSEKRDDRMPGV